MPRAWDDNEKEAVRAALIEQGRRLFERHGLKKTTVDEIAAAAGISKGAFYHFYGSKEELYFSILERDEGEFRKEVYAPFEDPGSSHRESFRRVLDNSVSFLISRPLYRQIDSQDLQHLMRKLPPRILDDHMRGDQEFFERLTRTWVSKGWMRPVDPQALTGVLLSLIYFVVNRDDFGALSFDSAKELLIDMITTYLIPETGGRQ